jgi:octaprenyl-diphosphate synthase
MLSPQERVNLEDWKNSSLIDDLACVENILKTSLNSENKLPNELSSRLILSGGKRIRPMLMCLTYRALEQLPDFKAKITLEDLHTLAAVAEWVHTATLFHDDVLDNSPLRRDMPTAQVLHGNKIAILVGDYVYADAFFLLMERALLEPSRKLASTIKRLVEGELWQHQISLNRSLDMNEYLVIAKSKTAALFAWAVETAAWASGIDVVNEAFIFGENLGIAFQMADDMLDTFELDAQKSEESAIREWSLSAPTLSITLAANHHSRAQEIWKTIPSLENLDENRKAVFELQRICAQQDTLNQSRAFFDHHLELAYKQLPQLASPQTLIESL